MMVTARMQALWRRLTLAAARERATHARVQARLRAESARAQWPAVRQVVDHLAADIDDALGGRR